MKRQNALYAICITLAVIVSVPLAIAVGAGGNRHVCQNGRIVADILASPIDGNAALKSGKEIIPISAGHEGHQSIAAAAASSSFKFLYIPLHIKATCKLTMQAGTRWLVLENIEEMNPVSDIETLDKVYTDFGIKAVKLRSSEVSLRAFGSRP